MKTQANKPLFHKLNCESSSLFVDEYEKVTREPILIEHLLERDLQDDTYGRRYNSGGFNITLKLLNPEILTNTDPDRTLIQLLTPGHIMPPSRLFRFFILSTAATWSPSQC